VLDWSGPGSASPSVDFSPSSLPDTSPAEAAATALPDTPWGGPVQAAAPTEVPAVPSAAPATAATAPAPVVAPVTPVASGEPPVVAATSAAEPSSWGNLDSIPTPKGGAVEGVSDSAAWGKLDEIPTPVGAGAAPRGGLGASMMGKARAGAGAGLLKNRLGSTVPPPAPVPPPLPAAEPTPVLDDAAAQKKLDQLMSSSNETSDYIFATGGLDARMLGRIDGWVSQIEAKDRVCRWSRSTGC
jgi:hypothetical protein